jgi:hypothetical protein
MGPLRVTLESSGPLPHATKFVYRFVKLLLYFEIFVIIALAMKSLNFQYASLVVVDDSLLVVEARTARYGIVRLDLDDESN